MAGYRELVYSHMSGRDQWDLCPLCWNAFLILMEGGSDG